MPRGAPKKADSNKIDARIACTVSRQVQAKLQELAIREGEKLSVMVRRCIYGYLPQLEKEVSEKEVSLNSIVISKEQGGFH